MNLKGGKPAHAVIKAFILLLCVPIVVAIPSTVCPQPVGLPSMGAPASEGLSPEIERQLGELIMVQGRRDPTYMDDTEVNQYLNRMGRKLVAFSPGLVPPVGLFAVRDPDINAFALPGGFIGVNSGLVAFTQRESELAAVVAHEIGHVVQRHIARGMTQQKQNSQIMLVSVIAALLAGVASGSGDVMAGGAAFGQAAAVDRQLGFSRGAESEADRVGLQMLTQAGYDPAGMVQMFARLMNVSRLNEGTAGGAWASTHPLSIDRMSDIENRVRQLSRKPSQESDDYWYVRAKLRLMQVAETGSMRTVVQQFQDESSRLTGVRQAAAYYGLALEALQRGALATAEKNLQQAATGKRVSPALAKLAIDVADARKDYAKALSLSEAAWQTWPDRYAIAMAYANALQQTGQGRQARTFLAARAKQWGNDEPAFYQLLAQSAERAGDAVQARLQMAQYYIRVGALDAAEAQLVQARSMSRDFYLQSQIDVQVQAVRERFAAQRQLLQQFQS